MRCGTSFGLFFLLAGGMYGQELPRATVEYGAFGFADLSGSRLLVVADVAQPAMLHTALCGGGRRFVVRFERRQVEREGNNGRQTAYNFDKLAGNVFAIPQGKVDPSSSCFLASDSLLSSARVVPLAAGTGECGQDVRRRFASARRRAVVNCRLMASLAGGKRLVLAEFALKDKDALASVVLVDSGRVLFADYAAVFKGKGEDLWRVDDGGVFDPEGFQIVFLLQRGSFYALGIRWSGSEGASLAVFVSGGGDRFVHVINDYWYQAPN